MFYEVMRQENYWSQYPVPQKEQEEPDRKTRKREELRLKMETSFSYVIVEKITKIMDKYHLDPILGLFPGIGDIITSLGCLPSVYLCLVRIKSIPLTLAVVLNVLVDSLIGMIPFWIGNICDFFNRSYLKNWRLIVGYVDGDEDIIHEINKKAVISAILIALMCYLIYLLFHLVAVITSWIASLFS